MVINGVTKREMNGPRRMVILAEGAFGTFGTKTGVGVIRYIPECVAAVIDSTRRGKTVDQVIGFGDGIPIVASLEESLRYEPDTLLIGIAPRGGILPHAWRHILREALVRGLDIISGLHSFISEDPEFTALARQHQVNIEDLRKPPTAVHVATGAAASVTANVILTVGSDCDTGKMTVTMELFRCARARGLKADCLPTGQTGMVIMGKGVALDRVAGDFMAGAVEQMIVESAKRHHWIFVEGQGSLVHPGYSGVALALLHGCAPRALVLCHQPSRRYIGEYLGDRTFSIPPLTRLVRTYEETAGFIRPAKVAAIALNCFDLSEEETVDIIERTERETGIPTTDPVQFGADTLLDALERVI